MHHALLPMAAAAAAALLAASPARASQALADKAGCSACHAVAKKALGPSYKEIAARYKGRTDAAAVLAASVRNGSKGTWGALPMAPTGPERLSDADLKALVSGVLKTP
ncbi:c-type cytochrome [Rubrivivax sp. RP6-9]|uniref:c-type cytochrome n=1 Tax=Rubrivivax sp. RP6-9 TaxID=3415750 RepID=UPI003CC6D963